MKNKIFLAGLVVAFYLASFSARADDLIDIYHQAVASDPVFKTEEANFMAVKEKLPISRAALLPAFLTSGSINRAHSVIDAFGVPRAKFYSNPVNYGLTLTQPIFNYAIWYAVRNASALVKQEEATYFFAAQDLMLRTAIAYVNILAAEDALKYDRAYKKSLATYLKQTKERYEVGLIAITDYYVAKSQYDAVVAQEIKDENQLAINREKLRQIIGKEPGPLAPLKSKLHLQSPQPNNVSRWMTIAEQQNYQLLSKRYATLAANENIKTQTGGHFPVINATGGYTYSYNSSNTAGQATTFGRQKVATAGLSVNLPVYQGGLVNAQVRQAQDKFDQASFDQETTHRQIISNTRQAYLSIIDAINKAYADSQQIISTHSAYEAISAGYRYGTQTMSDLLKYEAQYYQAENAFVQDQYNYIVQMLTLKENAGTLGAADIAMVNNWLQKDIISTEIAYRESKDIESAKSSKSSQTKSTAKKHPAKTKTQGKQAQVDNNLRRLNPKHYVLQVLASTDKRDIQSFMRRHFATVKMFYIAVADGNGTTYKLFAGDYSGLSQAIKAKTQLTKTLGKSIWPRQVATIINELD